MYVFHVIEPLVNHYVIVCKLAEIQPNVFVYKPLTAKSVQINPPAVRIQNEYNIISQKHFPKLIVNHGM